jgi:D-alanine-D-alanine ligase-like ATP-grasp enzyme
MMMMAHQFGKVAVLLGGRSAEREISLQSGQAVLAALRKSGIDAHPLIRPEQSLEALVQQGFDKAFHRVAWAFWRRWHHPGRTGINGTALYRQRCSGQRIGYG